MTEPVTLQSAAKELSKAIDALNKAVEKYYFAARAVGDAAPDGPTARGLDARQLRNAIQNFIVARLSPKPTPVCNPVLQFDGAPEARKYFLHHKLPGL